jgi:hypothetical protein
VSNSSSRIEFALNGPEGRPIGGQASVFGSQELESIITPLPGSCKRSNVVGDGKGSLVASRWFGRGIGSPIVLITPSNIVTKEPIYDHDLAISRRNSSSVWMRKIASTPSNVLVVGSIYRSMCSAIAVEIHVWLRKAVRRHNPV